MGRADVARKGPLDPASWPAWVLAFGKGYPLDPDRQAARRDAFHEWQRDRDAWFAERGIVKSVRACNDEHRHRTRPQFPARI